MIDRDALNQADKGMRNLYLIWAFLLGSLAIYLFVGIYLKDSTGIRMRETSQNEVLRWVLYLVSVVTFAMIYPLKRAIMKIVKRAERPPNTTKNPSPVIARYTTAVITSLAVAESIGIYGLVLYFLGGKKGDLISLFLLSAVAMVLHRPKREELLAMMSREAKEMGP